MGIDILLEDKAFVLCVKPSGVLSEQGGLPELLSQQLGGGQVFCVHRLDKETGGVMVYARTAQAAAKLSALIAGRELDKEYLAVVQGRPEADEGVLRDLLFRDAAKNRSYVVSRMRRGVKEAKLSYTLLQTVSYGEDELSLLRIKLHTGRTHQIRVQFSSRGMPLAGDKKYGSRIRGVPLALWSYKIAFPHPVTGAGVEASVLPAGGIWSIFKDIGDKA